MAIKVVKVLKEIPNGPDSIIKVSVVKPDKGKKVYLDIRKWSNTKDYTGPTKQGVWLHPEVIDSLIQNNILEEAIDVIDEELAPKNI